MSDIIRIFDTTLRDGEQSPGATMNLQEKVRLAQQLEILGVDCIEAGFPASSQGDFDAVKAIAGAVKNMEVAGLARCNDADIDRTWDAIRLAAAPRIHTFLATSPIHMEHKLRKSPQQVLDMAVAGVRRAASYTPNVEFSAEDASRSDPDFLVTVATAVIDAGAVVVNLPDTVGYAVPDAYAELVRYVIEHTPNAHKAVFSVHCHNDLGLATANTLAALRAGARQAEVTLSGIGERAGNTSLEEVVMALRVRNDFFQLDTRIRAEQIYPSCRMLSMIIGQPIPANKAIVGGNAFAHESGIHQAGVLANPETYEIMTPKSVGLADNAIVMGKHSGRNALKAKLESMGYQLDAERLDVVFEAMKRLADKKKEIFDEDVEALVLEEVYRIPDKYRLVHLAVHSADTGVPPSAMLVLEKDGEECRTAAFGVGPVDAVFKAIDQISGKTPELEQYSVNAITGGTDAQGEVTVRLKDGAKNAVGRGSDPDILIAGARAYLNALNRLYVER